MSARQSAYGPKTRAATAALPVVGHLGACPSIGSGRVGSAGLTDVVARSAVDPNRSARNRNAADGGPPPQPEGPRAVASHLFVTHRSPMLLSMGSGSLRDLLASASRRARAQYLDRLLALCSPRVNACTVERS